jgi:hypothetical protein
LLLQEKHNHFKEKNLPHVEGAKKKNKFDFATLENKITARARQSKKARTLTWT